MPRQSRGRAGLPLLVTVILAVALVLRLALAVQDWQAGGEQQSVAGPVSPVTAAAVDVAAVQALALFSDGTRPAATVFSAGSASGLDARLEGVAVASRAEDSRAVIVINGRQGSYRVGEVLPVGVDVTLKAVAADHVILDNGGSDAVLRLYDGQRAQRQGAPASAPTLPPGAVRNASASPLPAVTRQSDLQQRTKAAARLAEIIEVTPAAANGQLLGYRLAPGSRLKDFVQLGFKSGDIVTAINGIALADVGNLPELYRLMNEAGDVSFSLLRDGEPLTLAMTLAP